MAATKRKGKWKFSCYGSGDGALHFVWSINGKCEGRLTLPKDCERWLHRTVEGKGYKQRGYRLVKLNGNIQLVQPIKRVDAQTLNVSGRLYKYQIINPKTWTNYHNVNVTTVVDTDEIVVKNISTVNAICHFLRYEIVLESVGWSSESLAALEAKEADEEH
jgi:hypothetical protein